MVILWDTWNGFVWLGQNYFGTVKISHFGERVGNILLGSVSSVSIQVLLHYITNRPSLNAVKILCLTRATIAVSQKYPSVSHNLFHRLLQVKFVLEWDIYAAQHCIILSWLNNLEGEVSWQTRINYELASCNYRCPLELIWAVVILCGASKVK